MDMKHPGKTSHPANPTAIAITLIALAALSSCTRRIPGPGQAGELITLDVKGKQLVVEVASDDLSRQLGLMNRQTLPENQGMLFIFPESKEQGFWMKNTLVDLSIAFLDDGGKILQVDDMKSKDESHTMSKNFVRYALEVNRGWFQHNGIGVGDSISDFRARLGRFSGK